MARNNRELNYDSKLLVKLSKEEHEYFKKWASRLDLSMSALVRDLIFRDKLENPPREDKPYAGERMTWGCEFD